MTFVTPGYPPTSGGVEAHVAAIARRLAQQGWHVHVLTARRGLRRATTEFDGPIEVRVLPAWPIPSMSLSPRLVLAGLRARDNGIVHVHSYHAATGFAMLRRRPRLVFTPHYHGGGHTSSARLLHRGYRLLGRWMFANAAAVICVSSSERQQLEREQPAASGRITVIPNGVDVDRLRAAEPFDASGPIILSLGRLEAYKRVDTLIRAMQFVAEPVRLEILGDGPERSRLESLSSELGLDERIRFHGFAPTDDVARWISTATVLVSVSEHEAFGMVPVEAASTGARLVLSDIPAHRELHDDFLEGHDVLVDGGDPRELAVAITTQLGFGRSGPVNVPTWHDVANATAEVYRAVLDSGHTSGSN